MAELRNLQISKEEINKGKGMSVIAYLLILVLIPLLTSRDNKYVMFHTEQGLVLFVISVIVGFISQILDFIIHFSGFCGFGLITPFLYLFLFILFIFGIINALQGNIKKLPLIGDFGEKFNLIKQSNIKGDSNGRNSTA